MRYCNFVADRVHLEIAIVGAGMAGLMTFVGVALSPWVSRVSLNAHNVALSEHEWFQ